MQAVLLAAAALRAQQAELESIGSLCARSKMKKAMKNKMKYLQPMISYHQKIQKPKKKKNEMKQLKNKKTNRKHSKIIMI